MFKQYLWCLFNQFCEAKGLTNMNEISSDAFIKWIVEHKALVNMYKIYLEYLGFDYQTDDFIEVGKGKYDSLLDQGILISPFAETIEQPNSTLYIDKGIPLILHEKGITIPIENILLTHNPYFENEIYNWHLVHNMGEKNISIGMFGNLTDDDLKRKVKLLENLSKLMTEDYSLTYDEDCGNYFCSLNSKRYIKRRILSK